MRRSSPARERVYALWFVFALFVGGWGTSSFANDRDVIHQYAYAVHPDAHWQSDCPFSSFSSDLLHNPPATLPDAIGRLTLACEHVGDEIAATDLTREIDFERLGRLLSVLRHIHNQVTLGEMQEDGTILVFNAGYVAPELTGCDFSGLNNLLTEKRRQYLRPAITQELRDTFRDVQSRCEGPTESLDDVGTLLMEMRKDLDFIRGDVLSEDGTKIVVDAIELGKLARQCSCAQSEDDSEPSRCDRLSATVDCFEGPVTVLSYFDGRGTDAARVIHEFESLVRPPAGSAVAPICAAVKREVPFSKRTEQSRHYYLFYKGFYPYSIGRLFPGMDVRWLEMPEQTHSLEEIVYFIRTHDKPWSLWKRSRSPGRFDSNWVEDDDPL